MKQPNVSKPQEKTTRHPGVDNFYEAMPLTAIPHAVYSDDDDTMEADQYNANVFRTDEEEAAEGARRIAALVTLAVMTLVALGLIVTIVLSLGAINDATAPANQTGGSLEL